jgi:hypothetical protein
MPGDDVMYLLGFERRAPGLGTELSRLGITSITQTADCNEVL